MDGVLLDTESTVTECWVKAALDLGLDDNLIRKASIAAIGMNLPRTKELFCEMFCDTPSFDFDKVREVERAHFIDMAKTGIPVKKGAKELLSFLKENNAIIGLASSTYLENVTNELKAVGLFDYFDELVCGDMVKNGKPDPEIYLSCAKKLGIDIKDTYVIEDSYNGIKSAHSAGARVIMVPDCLPPTDETDKMCIATLPSLNEVIDYLSNNH